MPLLWMGWDGCGVWWGSCGERDGSGFTYSYSPIGLMHRGCENPPKADPLGNKIRGSETLLWGLTLAPTQSILGVLQGAIHTLGGVNSSTQGSGHMYGLATTTRYKCQ